MLPRSIYFVVSLGRFIPALTFSAGSILFWSSFLLGTRAATNSLEDLDEAILRPGRFDKLLPVPLPDERVFFAAVIFLLPSTVVRSFLSVM